MADRPRMHDWSDTCHYMDELEAEIERLRAALKDIQANAVGVNPPRHTWYYDRAEEALRAVGQGAVK